MLLKYNVQYSKHKSWIVKSSVKYKKLKHQLWKYTRIPKLRYRMRTLNFGPDGTPYTLTNKLAMALMNKQWNWTCKILFARFFLRPRQNEHSQSFVENVVIRRRIQLGEFGAKYTMYFTCTRKRFMQVLFFLTEANDTLVREIPFPWLRCRVCLIYLKCFYKRF